MMVCARVSRSLITITLMLTFAFTFIGCESLLKKQERIYSSVSDIPITCSDIDSLPENIDHLLYAGKDYYFNTISLGVPIESIVIVAAPISSEDYKIVGEAVPSSPNFVSVPLQIEGASGVYNIRAVMNTEVGYLMASFNVEVANKTIYQSLKEEGIDA